MRLKIRKFNWLAGRPVVFIHPDTAKKINVFQNDRVSLENSHKTHAVVDIFEGIVKRGEIGISEEVVGPLGDVKDGSFVDVHAAEFSLASKIIKEKLEGRRLTKEDANIIISQIVKNNLTEAEIAYFISAQKLVGMTLKESIYLTDAMIKTGSVLKFNSKKIVDKHCIGGVAGNRTTPIVVSICAVAGLKIPKTSSRAITSASGTADVVETISNVELSYKRIQEIVNKENGCLAWGGGLRLSPSDDRIIQVERLLNLDVESQLLASIMSKKIAAGSKIILIDIPYGEGAKFENIGEARRLGRKFKAVAKHFNVLLDIVYTDGSQPIGNGIGPVLEMLDVLKVLKNEEDAPQDLKNKSLQLSERLLSISGVANAKQLAKDILESGKAYDKFKRIINMQNKSNDFDKRISGLIMAKYKLDVVAKKNSRITKIDNKGINRTSRILGCPDIKSAGIYLYRHIGPVKKGEKILTMYSESSKKIKEAENYLNTNDVIKY